MKKDKHPQDVEPDTLRPEYDLSRLMQVGERGKYHKALRKGYTRTVQHKDGTKEVTHFRPLRGTVHLDPDVQAYFPDSEAVNAALRGLIALIPAKRRVARQQKAQEPPRLEPLVQDEACTGHCSVVGSESMECSRYATARVRLFGAAWVAARRWLWSTRVQHLDLHHSQRSFPRVARNVSTSCI
jgi:hypothetical protein